MKKFLISLLLMLPLSFAAQAQQKIGVVNTAAVMEALPDVKAATTRVQELAKSFDAEIKRMQDEFRAKAEAYQKEEATMSDLIKKKRQQELQEMDARTQNSYQTMQEELQKEQEKLMAPIRTKVTNAINKVCEAQGCAYIFESSVLLATGSTALDLTQAVKDALGIKAGATAAKPAAAAATPAKPAAKK